jgi:hypothetical protein
MPSRAVDILGNILNELKLLRSATTTLSERLEKTFSSPSTAPVGKGPTSPTIESTWSAIPKIAPGHFTSGLTTELKGADWADVIEFGNQRLRPAWIKWLGKITKHPAAMPFWSVIPPTEEQKNQKDFIISKIATSIIKIMQETLRMKFPNVGEFIIFDDKPIPNSDKPLLKQVSICLYNFNNNVTHSWSQRSLLRSLKKNKIRKGPIETRWEKAAATQVRRKGPKRIVQVGAKPWT